MARAYRTFRKAGIEISPRPFPDAIKRGGLGYYFAVVGLESEIMTSTVGEQELAEEKRAKGKDIISFSFGRNWQQFNESHLNAEREQIAAASLLQFLERRDLQGLTFLDIGCGSGLFSLAAYRLGASRIVSVDVDPYSVTSTTKLYKSAGSPKHWQILHGSILDPTLTGSLEPADVVYAWGSLHHTGAMWQAIRNAAALVQPEGLFFLAIYNKVEGRGSSDYWLRMKKIYNRSPTPVKRAMEVAYAVRYHILGDLIRLRNPSTTFRNYNTRGMNLWIDIRDWLGGYPYEAARADEVFKFCTRELGLSLTNLQTVNNLGCNEFLFRQSPSIPQR
jgi:2-polyprenyl-3-methyl-5-hydroxy-6-metoxy-1,4-benzoquinol methylase